MLLEYSAFLKNLSPDSPAPLGPIFHFMLGRQVCFWLLIPDLIYYVIHFHTTCDLAGPPDLFVKPGWS